MEGLFSAKNFLFRGYFHHTATLPSAPNPCLKISGMGLIGLPLNQREALALLAVASPAHNQERSLDSVVNESTACTWDIEPDNVEFGNPLWTTWVQDASKEVCARLGIDMKKKPRPQIRLQKLRIDGEGSA